MSDPRGETRNPAGRGDTLQFMSHDAFYAVSRRTAWFVRDGSREPPDPVLLARRPLYVVAAVLALVAVLIRQPLLFVGGMLIFFVTFVPELWYRFGTRGLAIARGPDVQRASFGDTVTVNLRIENRKPLPLPWLELDDEFPEALPVLNARVAPSYKPARTVLANILSLWAYQRVSRRYRVLACARGAHVFGPARLFLTDPFGILTREVAIASGQALLVHPLVAPLERFGLRPDAPFGERKSQRRLLEDPLRVVGTRAYAPGDEPRRIHWKATARTGVLQSKTYEPSTRHTLAIFLDTRTFTHFHMGYDPDLAELAICAAASVARWGEEQHFAVGIFSNGAVTSDAGGDEAEKRLAAVHAANEHDDPDRVERLAREIARYSGALRLRLPPSAHPEQTVRVLDGLARVLPYHGTPMPLVLEGELPRLAAGSTVVYIGTENVVDVALIVALRRARTLGHSVSLLLTQGPQAAERDADGVLHLAGLSTHTIGGRDTWEALRRDALGAEGARLADSWPRASLDPFAEHPAAGARPASPATDADTAHSRADATDDETDETSGGEPEKRRPRALVVE
ncbi:MAG: DUF58 domain-containing protein [Ktedonobacterales bacterium]